MRPIYLNECEARSDFKWLRTSLALAFGGHDAWMLSNEGQPPKRVGYLNLMTGEMIKPTILTVRLNRSFLRLPNSGKFLEEFGTVWNHYLQESIKPPVLTVRHNRSF